MKFDQFTINSGRSYHKRQTGLIAAVTKARELAARWNETVTVYADWTNYGYSIKPLLGCAKKLTEVTAREIVYVRPDGSLAHVSRATPESLEAYFAGILARLDAEQQISPEAQALAASWK
jgi:hypothetical protein